MFVFVTACLVTFVVQETANARRKIVGRHPQIVYKQDVYSMAILFAELLEPARPIFENIPPITLLIKVRVKTAVQKSACV